MLYLFAFLMNVTTGLMIISQPLFGIERLNVSIVVLGSLGTVSAGIYTLGCAGSGFLVDRIGFRKMLVASCLILLAAYSSIFLVTRTWHLFLLVAGCGLGASAFWPSMMRWLGEDERSKHLRKRAGNYNISVISGVMVGPLIGGFLFHLDYRYPFILAASVVVLILALLLIEWNVRRSKKTAAVREVIDREDTESDRPVKGFIYLGWLANFASWFAIGSSQVLFPKLALTLKIDEQVLGVLIALIAFGEIVVFTVLRKSHRWHYNFPLLVLFQFIGVGGLIVLTLSNSVPVFAGAFLLVGFAGGMTYFSSLYYSIHRQEGKGKKSGFHEAFLGLGIALGPIGGGLASRVWGLRAPYLLAAGVYTVAILGQVFLLGYFRKKDPLRPL